MSLSKMRMFIKRRVALAGIGPLRRPVELLESYARFGDWLRAHSCDTTFIYRESLYRYVHWEVLQEGPIDYLEFGGERSDFIGVMQHLRGST